MLAPGWSHRAPPLHLWVGLAGVMLLLQGALSLVIDLAGLTLTPLLQAFVGDPLHASIHVAWGIAMLLTLRMRGDRGSLARISVIFGCFYIGLALLGVLVYHPFGLRLGPGENVFHFLIGPASLVFGLWGLTSDASPPLPGRA